MNVCLEITTFYFVNPRPRSLSKSEIGRGQLISLRCNSVLEVTGRNKLRQKGSKKKKRNKTKVTIQDK